MRIGKVICNSKKYITFATQMFYLLRLANDS